MPGREGAFKAGPAGGLCLIATPEGLQHVNPCIFPFEVRPVAVPVLGCLNGLPRLFSPACCKEPLGNLGGNFGNLSDLWLVLGNIRVNVALGVGYVLQRQPDSTSTGALREIVA